MAFAYLAIIGGGCSSMQPALAPWKILVRSLHSPLFWLALWWGKSKRPHMGDPPTWVGVTRCGRRHGGGRRRFRPTDPVGKNVNLLCGFLWHAGGIFVVWLISRLVSITKGVWLPTVRGEGAIMSGLLPGGGEVMSSVSVRLGSHLCWLRPGSCG